MIQDCRSFLYYVISHLPRTAGCNVACNLWYNRGDQSPGRVASKISTFNLACNLALNLLLNIGLNPPIEGVDLQAKIGEHEAHVEQRCADALKGKCIHVLEATHFHCCFSYTEEF